MVVWCSLTKLSISKVHLYLQVHDEFQIHQIKKTVLLSVKFAPFRRRRDVSGVVPQGLSGEAGLEDLDGVEDEAGPDLCEGAVLLDDLEVAEPDAVVGHAEGEHVVEEGLAPRVVVRHAEYLRYIVDHTCLLEVTLHGLLISKWACNISCTNLGWADILDLRSSEAGEQLHTAAIYCPGQAMEHPN